MATSNEKDERRRRFTEKGLNRMANITSGRAQSTSSSSLPPVFDPDHHHHHHQPPPSHSHHLDQTNDTKNENFDAESKGARDEKWKIAETGLNCRSRLTTQSNPPILEHHALFSKDHQAPQPQPFLSRQISGT
ncbi:hypothetical protein REPUB_Repub13aG0176200 [Reevesia pubescens]